MMWLSFARRLIPSVANMVKDEYEESNGGCSSSDDKEAPETIQSKTIVSIIRLSGGSGAVEG
jgi:hypothetical protein